MLVWPYIILALVEGDDSADVRRCGRTYGRSDFATGPRSGHQCPERGNLQLTLSGCKVNESMRVKDSLPREQILSSVKSRH